MIPNFFYDFHTLLCTSINYYFQNTDKTYTLIIPRHPENKYFLVLRETQKGKHPLSFSSCSESTHTPHYCGYGPVTKEKVHLVPKFTLQKGHHVLFSKASYTKISNIFWLRFFLLKSKILLAKKEQMFPSIEWQFLPFMYLDNNEKKNKITF